MLISENNFLLQVIQEYPFRPALGEGSDNKSKAFSIL
jgi:hypothetical protein